MTETAPWWVTGETPEATAPTEQLTFDKPGYGAPPPPPPPGPSRDDRSRRRRPVLMAGALALTAAVAGASGVAVGAALEHDSSTSATASSELPAVSSGVSATIDPKSYAAVAAKVLPSVVSIDVSGGGQSGTGSGVIIRSNGYILTNNHVVSEAAGGGSIEVTFNDGSSAAASIVGTDAPSDLAVIKVDKSGLTAATLGKSSEVRVGDPVLAVGSPLGLSGTVTSGIVSALNRPVNTTDQSGASSSLPTVIDAIQTDAAINPGNSGGALVNAEGQVIGINSAIASLNSGGGQSGNIGVGFSIPIDQARSIASQLIASGHASHPMLGISLADATTGNGQSQALVQAVQAGSPADKAGLKAGDVITAVGGQRTDSADALIAAIRTHTPGESVKLTVLRDGKELTLTATLSEAATSQG